MRVQHGSRSDRLDRVLRAALPPGAPTRESPLLVTLVGVLISVAFAIVVDAFGGGGLTALGFGLAATLLGLQIDAMAQIARRNRADQADSDLLELLESQPWLRDDVDAVARACSKDFGEAPVLTDIARDTLHRARESLDRISVSGYGGPPDNQLLITLMQAATERVEATTIIGRELGYWQSSEGEAYWDANVQAMSRDVSIERTFVLDGAPDPTTTSEMRRQREAGVDVRYIDEAHLGPDFVEYVLIFDDRHAVGIDLSVRGRPIQYRLMVRPAELRTARSRLHTIRQGAARFEPGTPNAE